MRPADILTDPSASRWLKDALRAAMSRDAIDAANDARVLADVLQRCADIALGGDGECEDPGEIDTPIADDNERSRGPHHKSRNAY